VVDADRMLMGMNDITNVCIVARNGTICCILEKRPEHTHIHTYTSACALASAIDSQVGG